MNEAERYKPVVVDPETNIRGMHEVWFTPIRERAGFYHKWLYDNYPGKYVWYFVPASWHRRCEFRDMDIAENFVAFVMTTEQE